MLFGYMDPPKPETLNLREDNAQSVSESPFQPRATAAASATLQGAPGLGFTHRPLSSSFILGLRFRIV